MVPSQLLAYVAKRPQQQIGSLYGVDSSHEQYEGSATQTVLGSEIIHLVVRKIFRSNPVGNNDDAVSLSTIGLELRNFIGGDRDMLVGVANYFIADDPVVEQFYYPGSSINQQHSRGTNDVRLLVAPGDKINQCIQKRPMSHQMNDIGICNEILYFLVP